MFRSSLRKLTYLPLFIAIGVASLYSLHTAAAEDELGLLSFDGDLIAKLESLDEETQPSVLIDTYYALLPEPTQLEVSKLHMQLSMLSADYEVAYDATDSAEFSEIIDDVDVVWVNIRAIHAQQFTQEVVGLLNEAYTSALPVLDLH